MGKRVACVSLERGVPVSADVGRKKFPERNSCIAVRFREELSLISPVFVGNMALKIAASMGSLLAFNSFVDWTNSTSVLIARACFVVVAASVYFIWQYIGTAVERGKAENSAAPVWIKKPAPGLMGMLTGAMGGPPPAEDPAGPPAEYSRTTIYEIETAAVQKGGSLVGALFPLVMSMQMNIHLPIGMQCVTAPVNLYEEVIFKKYVMGMSTAPGAYGEVTADPTAKPATTAALPAAIAGAPGAAPAAAAASRAVVSADPVCEEALLAVWESKEPVDLAVFDALAKQGKDVNYALQGRGWTALHVVSGTPEYGLKDVARIVALGGNPSLADEDGWTPLHWASHHGNAAAVAAICGAFQAEDDAAVVAVVKRRIGGLADLAALLALQNSMGNTAVDVAAAEGNTAVEEALRAHAARAAAVAVAGVAGKAAAKAPRSPAGNGKAAAMPTPAVSGGDGDSDGEEEEEKDLPALVFDDEHTEGVGAQE